MKSKTIYVLAELAYALHNNAISIFTSYTHFCPQITRLGL